MGLNREAMDTAKRCQHSFPIPGKSNTD